MLRWSIFIYVVVTEHPKITLQKAVTAYEQELLCQLANDNKAYKERPFLEPDYC